MTFSRLAFLLVCISGTVMALIDNYRICDHNCIARPVATVFSNLIKAALIFTDLITTRHVIKGKILFLQNIE